MNSEINLRENAVDLQSGCGPLLGSGPVTALPLKQQIFEYVRSRGQAARSDITHALGISGGSATTLTADLIAGGYLREVESDNRETSRGRPRIALEVVAQSAYVIGIKMAFTKHTAVLADFTGAVVADASLLSGDNSRTVEEALDEVSQLIENLLSKTDINWPQIDAVGIGLPGMVDHETEKIVWSPLLRDTQNLFPTAFSARFGVPLLIDNDANMLTLAELWFGEGRAMSDFAVVTVESGVGMGLVLNNRLYRGSRGLGLELGHTKVQLDGALCRCGQRGCLEAYVADYALVREAATALGPVTDLGQSTGDILKTLRKEAQAGHATSKAIFQRACSYLALGLSNVVQLFDPEMIILSGERMEHDYLYANEVIEMMRSLTLNEERKPCRMAVNAWDGLVWARGASALALSEVTSSLVYGARAA
ncbi:MAG: ROK family protein [Roseobacter sp.]